MCNFYGSTLGVTSTYHIINTNNIRKDYYFKINFYLKLYRLPYYWLSSGTTISCNLASFWITSCDSTRFLGERERERQPQTFSFLALASMVLGLCRYLNWERQLDCSQYLASQGPESQLSHELPKKLFIIGHCTYSVLTFWPVW